MTEQDLLNLLTHRLVWLPVVMGVARLIMKWFSGPLQARLAARMAQAATGGDQAEQHDWEEVLSTRGYRVLSFTLDLLFSIKLPTLWDFLREKTQGTSVVPQIGAAPAGNNNQEQTMNKVNKGSGLLGLFVVLFTMLLLAAVTPARAQTSTNAPAPTLWDLATTGSNYWAAPFMTYSVKDHSTGGGVALGYRATEFVNPLFRVDYFNHQLYTVSIDAQLQVPQTLLGKIPVVPFGLAGVETPLSGSASTDAMVGIGAAVRLDFLGTSSFWQHADIVADYEQHFGLPEVQKRQIRFGFLYKF